MPSGEELFCVISIKTRAIHELAPGCRGQRIWAFGNVAGLREPDHQGMIRPALHDLDEARSDPRRHVASLYWPESRHDM